MSRSCSSPEKMNGSRRMVGGVVEPKSDERYLLTPERLKVTRHCDGAQLEESLLVEVET